MAQEIGDAVLRFLGDSTDLDIKFDAVGPDAERAFKPAAEAAEQASERMKTSMGEARGEVALLGEEFGIRLPRHIRSFVAELPGVGEAMSAAFSATAVLFLAQALVQAADKLSNFVGETFIFTDEMKAHNTEIANSNAALESLNKQREAAIAKLEELQGVTKDAEAAEIKATEATVAHAKAELIALKSALANKGAWEQAKDTAKDYAGVILGSLIPGYARLTSAVQDQIKIKEKEDEVNLIAAQAAKAEAAERAAQAEEHRQKAIHNQLEELENQKKVALAAVQTDQQKFETEVFFGEKKLALLKQLGDKEKSQVQAQLAQIEVLYIQHEQKVSAAFANLLKLVQQQKSQALDVLKDAVTENTVALSPLGAALQKAQDAAHSMGVTMRVDLVAELEKAKQAMKDFLATGITDPVAFKALDEAIKKADQDLKNFGKTEDSFLSKSRAWKEFQLQIQGASHGVDQLKLAGVEAFDSLEGSIAGAFQSIVLGQQDVGKALEQTLAQSLAAMASQAAVKALFYTAEGFAALAGFEESSASQYFTAAGEMAAVAVAAGVAGRALSGAANGGGGGSTAQSHDSISNTGQSNRSGGNTVSVQAFAEGGLVSGPTLALIGEKKNKEAVLPLEDPKAMEEIGKAIGAHGGGGGTTIHLNVHGGLIAESTIQRLCKQISKSVNNGKVKLVASNTLRITKKSA